MLNKNHDKQDYFDSLKEIYKGEPCKVLPYPFWKAEKRVDKEKSGCTKSDNGSTTIFGSNGNGLEFYWNNERTIDSQLQHLIAQSDYIMVHDDYFKKLKAHNFNHQTAFFRLIHENNKNNALVHPHGFSTCEVQIDAEVSIVSEFIAACYEHLKPSNNEVMSWTKHNVFDPRLWIWIKNDENNEYAALGIAEIDESVSEASLEWIQVHPKYQGKGIGKIIVLELLERMASRVDFTTVSGECDNATNPERLYRSCGFVGNDVWWHLRKEPL